MRRLIRVYLLLALVLGVSISSVTIGPRRQSMPPLLSMLRLTDCAPPCWIGIVPGETTIQAARSRLITVFSPNLTFDLMSPPAVVWATLRTKPDMGILYVTLDAQADNVVDTITFDFHSVYMRDRAALGDFHQVFGAPSFVALPSLILNSDDLGLLYGTERQGMMLFSLPRDAIRWDQPITSLVMYAEGLVPIARSAELRAWHGFRPLRQYYAAPAVRK